MTVDTGPLCKISSFANVMENCQNSNNIMAPMMIYFKVSTLSLLSQVTLEIKNIEELSALNKLSIDA